MHETDFTYDQTQQVARERQRVELSSEGLYDIQTLSVTVNTTEVDMESPPTFVIEWDGRESDRLSFQELQADTGKRLRHEDWVIMKRVRELLYHNLCMCIEL